MRSAVIVFALALAGPAAADSWTRTPVAPAAGSTPEVRGAEVFQARCAICHGREQDAAGTNSLRNKYGATKPAFLEERRDLTADTVKFFVRHGSGMMPFFRKTELSDAELDAVAAYLSRKRR